MTDAGAVTVLYGSASGLTTAGRNPGNTKPRDPASRGGGPEIPGPGQTQVSSHIRERHSSMGIAWPVYRGQK